jgi:hypothetical protein
VRESVYLDHDICALSVGHVGCERSKDGWKLSDEEIK